MATVTETIGSDVGDDHVDIDAWEDAQPADLTSPTPTLAVGVMRDEEHTGAGTSGGSAQDIDGHTTDASSFLRLTANTDVKGTNYKSFIDFKDDANFKLRYGAGVPGGARVRWQSGVAASIGLVLRDPFTEVSRLMFKNDYDYGGAIQTGSGGTSCTIKKCICEGQANSFIIDGSNSSNTVENCLVINSRSSGTSRAGIKGSYGTTIQFCTTVVPDDIAGNTGNGMNMLGGSVDVSNSASLGWETADFDTGFAAGSNYNASEDTTAPGANAVKSRIYADQFENIDDATADFRVKLGSGLIDVAEDSTGIVEDIVEQIRPGTDPTIGCWEFIAAGIDTRQKRFSMMGFGDGTYIHTKFEADGTIDADDRAHLLDLYSGIALAAPEEEGIIGSLGLLGVGL